MSHDAMRVTAHKAMNTPVKVVDHGSATATATANQSAQRPKRWRLNSLVMTMLTGQADCSSPRAAWLKY